MGQVSKPDIRAGARNGLPAVPASTGLETCPTVRSPGRVGNPKENRLRDPVVGKSSVVATRRCGDSGVPERPLQAESVHPLRKRTTTAPGDW